MNVWIGLLLAPASAVIVSWAYVREQSAVATLCRLSLKDPLRAVRMLVRTRAWLVGVAAEIGSWLIYFASLRLAPLALVQSVAASGVAMLALLQARGRPARLPRSKRAAAGASVAGLGLLGTSLIGSHPSDHTPSGALASAWLGALLLAALALTLARPFARGATSGLAAGLLFAAGDLSTKLVTAGGAWRVAVVPLIVGYALGSLTLQDGFQDGDALVTAGIASLANNAVPIAAGIALFHQPLPQGPRLVVQLLAFALVVASGALLARGPAPAHVAVPAQPARRGTFGTKQLCGRPRQAAAVQKGEATR